MAANEPHAYVAGEIIECMACSDNVVRAGLTPKYKDVPNLVEMLTYSMGGPSIDVGEPLIEEPRIARYTPPVPEFEVMIMTLEPGESLELENPKIPAILLVVEGSGEVDGKKLRPGQTYYWETPSDQVRLNKSADVAAGSEPAPSLPSSTLIFTVDAARRGPLKVAIAHENKNLDRPTSSTGTAEFPNLHGSLPWMGNLGRSPTPTALRNTYVAVDADTPAIPKL